MYHVFLLINVVTIIIYYYYYYYYYSGSSGGDVHIRTIDGVEYDFNGHGEYVFLKLQNEYV